MNLKMKKMKFILPVSLITFFVAGCGNNETAAFPDETLYPQEPITEENSDNVNNYAFSLNNEELEIYEMLKEELSTSVLEGVNPFSIAKIYIQAGLDGEWEIEYSMFNEIGLERSLEEWIMYSENERALVEESVDDFNEHLRTMANSTFALLEDGEFIEENESEAYILFENIYGDVMVFRFMKNESGIWEVMYTPIQFAN